MYVLHTNMPERVRDSANMGGKNLQILKLLNVMVTSFCIDGGGSSRLIRSPESDPNARGRVRAWDSSALCSNEESPHISAGMNCDATEPSC